MNLCSEFCVSRFTSKERREGGMDSGSAVFFFLSFLIFYSFLFFFRCSRRTYQHSHSKLSPVTIPRMTGPFFGS